MDSTVSVSKGVFVFKNGIKSLKEARSRKKSRREKVSSNIYANQLWYESYSSLWNLMEKKIENLNREMYSNVLANLLEFIKSSYVNPVTEIPSGALLTGINMPDHAVQFTALAKKVKHDITPHVAVLYAQDCQSIRYLVDNMISQFVNYVEFSSDDEGDDDSKKSKILKSQFNFSVLQAWYENEYKCPFNRSPTRNQRSLHKHKVLVVIMPDFESVNEKVLQHFILITSSYINILPFVLVFGIATSLTVLHKTLPYHVSSKVNIQVFHSQPSVTYLNDVLEHVFLTDDCPFHLGGKLFTLFTDVFLFYDFSVTGFIQKYKYAMLEHFSYGNVMALCTKRSKAMEIINKFNHDDCENVRRLLSFQRLLENETSVNKRKLQSDDAYFKTVFKDELEKIFKYFNTFHVYLKCLHVLVNDLPKTPLGRHLRELYGEAATEDITKTSGYKECFQLLNFQSKKDLMKKMIKVCELLESEAKNSKINRNDLDDDVDNLCSLVEEIELATLNVDASEELVAEVNNLQLDGKLDRKKLKEKLLENAKRNHKPMNKYEIARKKLLEFVSSLFEKYLYDPKLNTFHEIFFFDDISIESHIIGTHRAAIHAALNDPHSYLQCVCCKMPNDTTILKTMPDVSILYKLHLEYGKMINLYDWMQAFFSIIDPIDADDDEEETKKIDPKLQARFTLAVAELEFLGFIKSSKRKTDHVQRLTWGG